MAETDLTKMSSAELVEALIKDNSIAEEFDRLNLWGKFDSSDWSNLLIAQPQFIKRAKNYSNGWFVILQTKPELAQECDKWNEFNFWNWPILLKAQPQFADKCTEYNGWVKIGSSDCRVLLEAQPQLWIYCSGAAVDKIKEDPNKANECKCWNWFYPWNWSNLLQSQPQFADKCTEYNGWEKFDSSDWSKLLSSQPQLWIYCPGASVNKIKEDPTKAKECKCWERFNSSDWSNLLKSQPQFADKCTKYKGWEKFGSNNWRSLLESQPQFADKCTEYNGWQKFDSWDWRDLLKFQPQFADKCTAYNAWKKFDSWDWINLLETQPQFADKYDWSDMKANNYDEYDEYEYEDFEYWKEEYGEDYSEGLKNLLLKQPQLAEYFTDVLWDEFSQEQWAELEAQHSGVFEDKHMLSTLRKLAK